MYYNVIKFVIKSYHLACKLAERVAILGCIGNDNDYNVLCSQPALPHHPRLGVLC